MPATAAVATLTRGRARFAAASITDGVNFGYWQYLSTLDLFGRGLPDATAAELGFINGTSAFGEGLLHWMQTGPTFNMDKVSTPLQVVGAGLPSLFSMWEPYATLRRLGKPVDLLLLNTDEHVLTQPAIRLASQGGSVDWFRFWLQGHEDTDPAKAGQYRQWESLCDVQKAQAKGQPTFCVPTRG